MSVILGIGITSMQQVYPCLLSLKKNNIKDMHKSNLIIGSPTQINGKNKLAIIG